MIADLALNWSNALLRADVRIDKGDIELDAGLRTAVIVSLFTDRQALPGDRLPDNLGPRGWWGTAYLGYSIGSRLWLLRRSTMMQTTLNAAQDYAREALQWMIDDGVAGSINTIATATSINGMNLAITINQKGGSQKFDLPWKNQLVSKQTVTAT